MIEEVGKDDVSMSGSPPLQQTFAQDVNSEVKEFDYSMSMSQNAPEM
jgi:hypothetical protein